MSVIESEERKHLFLELTVVAAFTFDEQWPLIRRQRDRPSEQIACFAMSVPGAHAVLNSRRSHAFATRVSALTVRGEMPSSPAVSSTVRPVKKRSSTIVS